MRFHVVKRDGCPLWKKLGLYVLAVLAALILGGVVLLALGVNPLAYYSRMFTMGMVGNKIAYKTFENYLKVFVPLALTSVALSLAFKMRFWNIGGEGQFILGAVAATTVAFKLGPVLPSAVTLILMCLAGMLAAGIYGAIVAVLKVKFGTNETLMTLMLNYVALYFVTFLGETQADWNFYLDKTSARPIFATFSQYVSFPRIPIGKFGLNVCVIFTVVIGILVFVYLKYTKHGYEIAVVGDSENTARYAGIRVPRIYVRTMALSGALCGFAGFLAVSAVSHTLSTSTAGGRGYTAINVAWLAKMNPYVMILISALLSFLDKGAVQIASDFGLNEYVSKIISGVILFFILGSEFFINYQVKTGAKHK